MIDHGQPYVEEEFQEIRYENLMIRNIGPCMRCKSTMLQWDRNERSPLGEPYNTLQTHRKYGTKGCIFGVYFQSDIIANLRDFLGLLGPSFKLSEEAAAEMNPEFVTMKVGGQLMVRTQARVYGADPPKVT